ncbi:transposase [Streptomyces sp. NPDC058084]|uniref:transposase n=1 Tax=Streptomyces sp. NPDC058084 TaxID=3346333 RepID=UPI0036E54C71
MPGASWIGPQRSPTPHPCARKGCSLTGLNPVDRGKKGSKLHVLSEAQGIPLAVAVSGANGHDSQAFMPLLLGLPAILSRRGPRRRRPVKVRADKAYFSAEHLAWLLTRAHPAHRAPGDRVRRAARPTSLEDREVDRLAVRLPPPRRPL